MRILVYPHSMEIGGSQLNALELAAAVAARGHDVVVFAESGELDERVRSMGLPHVLRPRPRVRPSPVVLRELVRAVREHHVDVVHAYEWPPIIEAVYGPWLRCGTAVLGTVMSMSVAPFIPAHLPLTVGTASIVAGQAGRPGPVHLLEPPVDTRANAPGDRLEHRARFGLGPDELVVAVVSRLAPQLKREGILAAVRAVGQLAPTLPVRLLVAGDGPSRAEVESLAAQVNATVGRPVVSVLGAVDDPRPVYQSADVVLGMGGSALRAMAFARPLVVQGERGFWRLLDDDSLPQFLREGWYGLGDGSDGAPVLADVLARLHAQPQLRDRCATLARRVVVERFSLDSAAERLEQLYAEAVATRPHRLVTAPRVVRPLQQALLHDARRKVARRRGRLVTDDFNDVAPQTPHALERTSA